jgi:glycosyltransferase involved in cell wall biosynthesis
MKKYLFIMAQVGHPWGGSEALWSSAAEHLVRSGNEVRISVRDWGRPVPEIERLRAAGCQIFHRDYRLPSFISRQFRRVFRPPAWHLSEVVKAGTGVDLAVISQGASMDGLEWMEAAGSAGIRYIPIAQSAVVYWWPDDDTAARLKKAYENASASYFVSQSNVELSRWQFGSPLCGAKVVRNPFSVRYDPQLPWPSVSVDTIQLACIARLDVISKGQDVLLQVLGLPHWRERKIHLRLVGTGPHERSLRGMVEQLKLTNVEFAGQQENVEEVWAKHHALVLPSRFEGMPLVVVEAMLCGRPCIVTDVGGNRELVRDGINGFIAKAPTVELLDETMNRAWERRDQWKEIGLVAATDARQFVSPDPGKDFARELSTLAGESYSSEAGE